MTLHEKKAAELFMSGYNCAQAAFCAFADELGLDNDFAKKISSSFGGGMGRMREVCGAVSGALMALGCFKGYDVIGDDKIKMEHYARVQGIMKGFADELGSYICRDIIKVIGAQGPMPTPRTAEFYKTRPCARMVMLAAKILDEYIEAHPVGETA